MYCSKCGSQLNAGDKFCNGCGSIVEQQDSAIQQPITNQNSSQPKSSVVSSVEQQPMIQNQQSNNYVGQAQVNMQNNNDLNYNSNVGNKKDKKGLFALLCGIGSILFAAVIYLAVPLGIGGIFLGTKEQPRTGKGKAGKILGIIGIVLAVLYLIGSFVLDSGLNLGSNTYYGNGYELKYDYNWRIGNLQGGQEALIKDSDNSYLVPIGKSNLSQSNYIFDTDNGKKQIYDEFYSMWNSSMSSQSLSLFNGSNGFSILKGNIYYATIDYGKSSDKLNGQYYILISKENDIVLTFMSNAKPENSSKANDEVLKMLKEINITDSSSGSNNNSNNNGSESFTPGTTKDFTALGYMDYDMPECWQYDEQRSAGTQYKSYVFDFKDGKSLVAVQAFTPVNNSTFQTGKTYEEFKNDVENANMTIIKEDTKTVNGIKWYHIVTAEYAMTNFEGNLHSEYYVTFSKTNKHLYMFHFYVSNSTSDIKYLNDSIDYILNNAKLLKYEE